MSLTGVEEDYLTLLDWRRRVSTLYAGVRGALVTEPQADSPAAQADVLPGDVITAVNGNTVKDARDLAKQIGAMDSGSSVKLTMWRKAPIAAPPRNSGFGDAAAPRVASASR